MPKINHEEYEVLKELDDQWKWIARDGENLMYGGELQAYTEMPQKRANVMWTNGWGSEKLSVGGLFQFIQWEDEEPHNIAELIEDFEEAVRVNKIFENSTKMALKESEETEVKKDREWAFIELGKLFPNHAEMHDFPDDIIAMKCELLNKAYDILSQLDEPEQLKITLQDVTDKLWELPSNNRKLWLARLNDEFQEGYIVPLGLKTTDGEEQYLTYNGSYFASRRNKYLQQTFDTLEEIPEFYRELAERVL